MAILNSKSGYSYDTETKLRTNPDGTTQTINSNTLDGSGSNIKLPESKDTASQTITMSDTTSPELKLEREKIAKEKTSQENTISSLMTSLGVEQGKEAKYATEAGADKAQQEYDRYASELEAEQRRIDKFERDILRNNPTGALRGGQADLIKNEKRASLEKQADIAILGNAAKGRFDTAMDIAKRKVESSIAPLKAELDAKKFIYENNKDLFSKAQLSKLDTLIKADERKIEEETKNKETIEKIKIEAFKNGFKGDMSGVKTVDEALNKVGSFLMSPKEKLEIEKLRGDVAKNTLELLAAKSALGGTTGDPTSDIIAGSSRYGDKRLTDSQLDKIQKATSALGSMETLQSLLSQGKDGVNVSGPVTGRLRTLYTQLGGDANASAINATIQGLIPTVARGIFGEVGVLTDADIENYRKTVPNLNATGEQNKLISLVMYDVLSRSLENTLVSNAQNQANVSNFLGTYTDVKNRVNTLKSNLGIVETTQENPTTKAYLDNKLDNGLVDNINSAITNYSSQFTR